MGWWRTNRWWLPALVVALAALGLVTWRADAIQGWWTSEPHRPAVPDAGWSQVGDVQYRLAGLEGVDRLADEYGGEIEVPDGYTLWIADLAARSDTPAPDDGTEVEPTYSCTSELRDTEGRVFDAGASALSGVPYPDALVCAGPVSQRVLQYFLTPDDAVPAEVRVVDTTLLPDYWSLPAPGTTG